MGRVEEKRMSQHERVSEEPQGHTIYYPGLVARTIVGWPDAPAMRMATNARYVKLPADKAKQALGPAVGEHLKQPLPEGTEITHIGVQGGDVIVEFTHPDFGELPPGVSQEVKPREAKKRHDG
jgi:hypothetical protein